MKSSREDRSAGQDKRPVEAADTSAERGGSAHGASAATETMDVAPPEGATSHGPLRLDLRTFVPAIVIVGVVVLWGLFFTDNFSSVASSAFSWTVGKVDWLFILSATTFVAVVLIFAFGPFGSIRLGGDDERPTFSTPSWISMMFAAGMGIGLMFYGVNEPLAHFRNTPPGAEPGITTAMATTTFHWTAHAWSVYAIVGIALALTAYRYGGSHLISSAFVPLIGEKRARGWLGRVIDVLAILSTVFGTAASLGLGAMQIQAGLEETGAISGGSIAVIIGIVIVLGLCFVLSAVSGIERGIQWLSNINGVVALLMALFVALTSGALVFMLDLVPTSIGAYFQNFFAMASRSGASADGTAGKWLSSWTVFYWAWWISWSPFVGMFLARISRGRTIREFVVGVILVPSLLSIVWFAIFGGEALHLEISGHSIYGEGEAESQLFAMFRELPMTGVLAVVAMFLIAIFFITGADSASIIMAGMCQDGAEEPWRWLTVLWGTLTAAVAVLMLLPGADSPDPGAALQSLQSITIVAATPFVLVLIGLCVSMWKAMSRDPFVLERKRRLGEH